MHKVLFKFSKKTVAPDFDKTRIIFRIWIILKTWKISVRLMCAIIKLISCSLIIHNKSYCLNTTWYNVKHRAQITQRYICWAYHVLLTRVTRHKSKAWNNRLAVKLSKILSKGMINWLWQCRLGVLETISCKTGIQLVTGTIHEINEVWSYLEQNVSVSKTHADNHDEICSSVYKSSP